MPLPTDDNNRRALERNSLFSQSAGIAIPQTQNNPGHEHEALTDDQRNDLRRAATSPSSRFYLSFIMGAQRGNSTDRVLFLDESDVISLDGTEPVTSQGISNQ